MEYISCNTKETNRIAKQIITDFPDRRIYALSGNLGSGKTTFSQGVARFLGVSQIMTSPTFVLLKTYQVDPKKAKQAGLPQVRLLAHFDGYRIAEETDLESIGMAEYLGRQDALLLIEWPERIEKLLPKETLWLKFEYVDENCREIKVR